MPGSITRDTMRAAVLAELVQHAQQQLLARRAGFQSPVRPGGGGGDVYVKAHRDGSGRDVRAYYRRRG